MRVVQYRHANIRSLGKPHKAIKFVISSPNADTDIVVDSAEANTHKSITPINKGTHSGSHDKRNQHISLTFTRLLSCKICLKLVHLRFYNILSAVIEKITKISC